MRPGGSVKNVALLCSGRKGPGGSGLGASGTLSPSSQPCGNGGSLTCAESLLRFCPTALLLCLNPPPVNRDPPPSRYKERGENGGVCGQIPFSHGLSLSTSSVMERGDSDLAGFSGLNSMIPVWCHPRPWRGHRARPSQLFLLSFVLSICSGQGPGHRLTVEAMVQEGLRGRWLPVVWGGLLAGPSKVQGGPRSEARQVSTGLPQ